MAKLKATAFFLVLSLLLYFSYDHFYSPPNKNEVKKELEISMTDQLASTPEYKSTPKIKRDKLYLMALGDSITQGCCDHKRAGYRYYLWEQLQASGYVYTDFVGSMTQVYGENQVNMSLYYSKYESFDKEHEGHSDMSSHDISKKIHLWANTLQPEMVLVHLGTDDILKSRDVDFTLRSIENIITRLREEVDRVSILVAQIIPITIERNITPSWNEQVLVLNARIKILVDSLNNTGSPLYLVNHYDGFNPESMLYDGLHPNYDGERVMAQKWFEILQVLLPKVDLTTPTPGDEKPHVKGTFMRSISRIDPSQ